MTIKTEAGITLRGDIKFTYKNSDTAVSLVDIDVDPDSLDVVSDPAFETAVLIALLTDTLASDDDKIPDNSSDRRGWWADVVTGQHIGSRLWLLQREKCDATLPTKLEEATNDALKWLVTDAIAKSVTSSASRIGTYTYKVTVQIVRSETQDITFTYFYNWYAQTIGGTDAI